MSEKRYHHGNLREALLEAAARIFDAEGPEAISMRALARAAGVSSAAPFRHFADKQVLLDAIAVRLDRRRSLFADRRSGSGGARPGR